MVVNPYEPTFSDGVEQKENAGSSYFSIASVVKRISPLFTLGAILGIVLVVTPDVGFLKAVRELADPGGLRMLSITIPFACLASAIHPSTEPSLRRTLIRFVAGLSLGVSFFMLVTHTDDAIGDFLGINMHTNAVAIFVFPFSMYLIAVSVSILIESVARHAICPAPSVKIQQDS